MDDAVSMSARFCPAPGIVFVAIVTGGPDPEEDRIIEVGAVRAVDGAETGRFSSLIASGTRVPLAVRRLTGIDDALLAREGASGEDAVRAFRAFAGGASVWVCDAASTEPFLARSGLASGEGGAADLCELACMLTPTTGGYSLHSLAARLGVPGTFGRALDEARAMFGVWTALLDALDGRHADLTADVARAVRGTRWPLAGFFERLARETGCLPAPPGAGTRESWHIEARLPASAPAPVDPLRAAAVFEPGGVLDRAMPGYERRPQQGEMAALVAAALEDGRHLFVEAGTGVGKSLAYLVPAIMYAAARRTKVVISTNTRNLQDQLWNKEIPFLADRLGIPFKAALIKGRENYVCLRRWREAIGPAGSLFEERLAIAYLSAWRRATTDGLLETVGGPFERACPTVREIVGLVRSSPEACLERFCPFRRECFYQRARRSARSADILIANHALTLAAPRWFPPFDCAVLDEAQNVEGVATDLFSREVSSFGLLRLARDLSGRADRRSPTAPLWRILRMRAVGDGPADVEEFRSALLEGAGGLRDCVDGVASALEAVFAGIRTREEPSRGRLTVPRMKETAGWTDLSAAAESLAGEAARISAVIGAFEEALESFALAEDEAMEAGGILSRLAGRLDECRSDLSFALGAEDRSFVSWGELVPGAGRTGWKFRAAPLEPGSFLADFYEKRSVVHTSGTLTVGGSFDFIVGRVGANAAVDRVSVARFDSPFDYRQRVVLAIPRNFPAYDYRDPAPFVSALGTGIAALVGALGGKFLVLFSSAARMRAVAEALKSRLEEDGIVLLCQGADGSRAALAERMRALQGDAVLLGTRSFKEGIDIPGLRGVAIDKIPFASPADPVVEARRRLADERGGNHWEEYALPTAAMDLRQSVGRLMRRTADRGVIVVFDTRLLTRFRELLRSFPPCRMLTPRTDDFEETMAGLAGYFAGLDGSASAESPSAGPSDA